MFIEALLVTAKSWKKFRRPSMGEWLNKLWYIHTAEYHLVIKRKTRYHNNLGDFPENYAQ